MFMALQFKIFKYNSHLKYHFDRPYCEQTELKNYAECTTYPNYGTDRKHKIFWASYVPGSSIYS